MTRLKSEMRYFFRFCMVGAIGFAIDGGILAVLVYENHVNPYKGRLVSFSLAVVATFYLNKIWSFSAAQSDGIWKQFANYLGIQGIGLACNVLAYVVAMNALPWPFSKPLGALVLASGLALAVNFAGVRIAVFRNATLKR
jgi:putative flippase GtrA